MQITKVELENIKSYEEGMFEFGPGVIAISGPNGAGKTTILEAIAWALFDQLPYKKEDFLRRGAKKGSVRVSFISALDGREYTVYRDTGAGYYIHDPITRLRLVEQKNQVGGWLKQHLGVDAGADLKSLFTSTIGVPQGTFAVDFADQPAKRKVGFDKVLRVDEYHRSSDDLRSVVKLVEVRDADLREEIARVEVEVSAWDSLEEEKTSLEKTIKQVKTQLDEAERERERTRVELERLDDLQRRIERLAQSIATLATKVEEGQRRREAASNNVMLSRGAKEAVAASARGYEDYIEANARLAELEPLALRRDELKKQLSEKEREQSKLEGLLQAQREKLKQIEADRLELERLTPLVKEQEDLESRRGQLQTALGEATVLREREAELERELKELRREYSGVAKQIDEAENLKAHAERVPTLESDRRAAEIELRESQVQVERLKERKKDLKRVRENIARLTGEINTLDKEVAAASRSEELAAALPRLEADDQQVMEEMARLKAAIEREKEILSQIKGGLCPLLSERCLNMKEGQGLDQFFKLQVGNESKHLTSLERKRKDIQQRIHESKAALKIVSALAAQRVHHSRFTQDLEIERKAASRLETEISTASVNDQTLRSLSERLEKLDTELREAQSARTKYERLDILRERLEQLKKEGGEKKKSADELQARISALGGLSLELERIDGELAKLEDPRGRSRALRLGLEKETQIRESLVEMEQREQNLGREIRALTDQLESFADLDEQLATARERRAASEKDHRIFIENQPIAAMLEQREKELGEIERELETNREQLDLIEREVSEARSEYDGQRHAETRVRLENLFSRVATLSSDLNAATARLAELETEIMRLLAAKERMAKLQSKRERFKQLLEISDFIRDLLKKAGPFITEAHLQSISIEANQLYREITGNPMVSLRWDTGYEIILEEEGHERPFTSLSGGEQMAAALAVRLALLKELSDMRIAFFDEPTTNMDEERRRNLAQQIGRIKDFDQLFVISHDDAFEGFTDSVISVRGAGDGVR